MKAPAPAVIDQAIAELTLTLVAWGARKVILFGSVAHGDYNGASDIDLIIVKESTARLPERIAEALDRCSQVELPLPVEPLVYTPREFDRLVAAQNPLVTDALRNGRVLHDAA
jgi:predicted nucleotidyltransferase